MKNKKAQDKILSVYWFVILFIVAGVVVYMGATFYGEPFDVREAETNILINQISNCLSEGGKLKLDIYDGKEFLLNSVNFLEKCKMTFEVEETKGWKNDQHYIEISFLDFNTSIRKNFVKQGNFKLKNNCDNNQRNFPYCKERSFYTLDENKNQYEVKIYASIRKTEKNA